MIELKNINKKIDGKIILENINLKFNKNKIYGIVGHNGSSKTMLLNVISGNLSYDSGEICKGEINIAGCIGKINLIDSLTVIETLSEVSKNDEKIYELLKYFNILKYKNTKIFKLSLGTKQKVWIITLFLRNPNIYILDEPFNGLDDYSQKLLKNKLLELKKNNKCVILVSHNEEDIEELCDEIYELECGRVISKKKNEKIINTSFKINIKYDEYKNNILYYIKKYIGYIIIITLSILILLYHYNSEKTLNKAISLMNEGKYTDAKCLADTVKRLPNNIKKQKIQVYYLMNMYEFKSGLAAKILNLKNSIECKELFNNQEINNIIKNNIKTLKTEIIKETKYSDEQLEEILKHDENYITENFK